MSGAIEPLDNVSCDIKAGDDPNFKVTYDPKKVDLDKIIAAINATDMTVTKKSG